jgi:hypothetical protein
MKKINFLIIIVSLLILLLVTGCTRTASKTPITPVGGSEDIPQEPIPTKTFVVPKVVISTPSPEIISTPTMKLFVATTEIIIEQEQTGETIEPTVMTENIVTEEIEGTEEIPVETVTPFELITLTLPPNESEITERYVTEETYEIIYLSLKKKFSDADTFWYMDDEGPEETSVRQAIISEQIADIYQDIKDFVVGFVI